MVKQCEKCGINFDFGHKLFGKVICDECAEKEEEICPECGGICHIGQRGLIVGHKSLCILR